MKPRRKAIASLAFVFSISSLLWLSGCKSGPGGDDDDETTLPQAQKSAAQLSVVNGESVIALDPATQTRLGLTLAPLATTTSHAQQQFPAVVLSTTDLATLRGNLLSAQAQFEKARVTADVANKEYTRLKTLYSQDQNISRKSLEAAEGESEVDQTDVAAAQQQLDLQKSLIAQQWGGTIADWAQQDSPAFERVLSQHDALVQVTMAADSTFSAPPSVTVENLDGSKSEARLVSRFPRVDPRVQGRSFLYIVSPRVPIAPETSLLADIAVGTSMKGVVVPTSAVVWSEGRAWVYQQTGDSQFTRRAVPTNIPLAAGYFVSSGLPADKKVVTVGAQAMLSEEFLLRGASAGTNDD